MGETNAGPATNSDCYRVLLPLFPGVFSYNIILQMLIDAEGQPSNHVNIPNVTQMVILEDMGHLTLPTSNIYLYHTYHAFAQSYPLFVTPFGLYPTRLLCPRGFSGKNTGVGRQFLLQEMFPTQGLNLHLLCLMHWQVGSLLVGHWGSSQYILHRPGQNQII